MCDVGLSPLPRLGPLGHCCVPRVPQPCCSTWQVPIPLPCPERKVHLPCELGRMLGVIPQPFLESVLVPLTEGQEHGGERGWDCPCARWAGVGAAHVHVEAPGPPWSAHRARRLPLLGGVCLTLRKDQTHITITDPEMWDVTETGFSLKVPCGVLAGWGWHPTVRAHYPVELTFGCCLCAPVFNAS